MITREEIDSAIRIAEPMFEDLDKVYGRLPETRCNCQDPGICCAYLPEMTALEALRWLHVMRDLPDEALAEKLRRFVSFYFLNPVRLTGCPFLENGGCTIYADRTFACRAYGLWSQTMGRNRTRESRKERQTLRQMWKRFGIDLPGSVVEFEIDYCNRVETLGEGAISDKRIMALLREAYALDTPLRELQEKFETIYHSDISLLLTALAFGMKKAILEKFAVVKEVLQTGSEARLKKLMDKLSVDVLRI